MARTPLYKIAETEMLSRISKGTWKIGRRLPNEFELADEFGVSQGTMRRALISLEGMGYLDRKPGRGTLVAAPAEPPVAAIALPRLLDEDGAALVLHPFRARSGTRAATSTEVDLMGTARLAYVERTLKSAGARAAIDEIVVPERMVAKLSEDAPIDLAGFLEAHGLIPARITAEASVEMTDMGLSVSLAVDRHTALLCVTFTAHDAAGAVIARQVMKLARPGVRLTAS